MIHSDVCVRRVAAFLLTVFVMELTPALLLQARGEEKVTVENIRVSKTAGEIVLVYDLLGVNEEGYNVTVTLRREEVIQFKYSPKKLSGDVGEKVLPGTEKKIVWSIGGEFPLGLMGDDYYFVIDAKAARAGGGVSPLVWIGGGVVVAGGALFLLLSGKEASPTSSSTAVGLPDEPVRPR